MPNVHLKEAARNVRRALNDIDLKIRQVRAEIDDKVRASEDRINDIKQQQAQLSGLMTQAESDGERTSRANQIRDLEQEIAAIRHNNMNLRQEQTRIEQDLVNFKAELEGTAHRLEMTA